MMLPCQHSPHKVLHHGVILILTSAVVSMQGDRGLSQSMVVKEVVEHADNCIGTLPYVRSLIDDEVHLSGDCLTADPKQGSLPRSQEVDWARLEGVGGGCLGCLGSAPVGQSQKSIDIALLAGVMLQSAEGGEIVPSGNLNVARTCLLLSSTAALYTERSCVTNSRCSSAFCTT